MSVQSDIEWTDATWNPVRGCVKVSPGCKHCYAETFAERFRDVKGHPYEHGFDPRLVSDKLDEPLKWRKPKTIFVNSMSDLFGEFVPCEYIAACFGVMAATPRHRYQVLTKRAGRMSDVMTWMEKRAVDGKALFPEDDDTWRMWQFINVTARRAGADVPAHHGGEWPLPNVDIGVSVEDIKYGLPRIEHLRRVPIGRGAVRFLSIEPLLEDLGALDLSGIGWVIVGGESGAGARSMHIEWARAIVAQCREQGVPVFVKQLGAAPRMGGDLVRLRSRKGGEPGEWPEDMRIREMPNGRFVVDGIAYELLDRGPRELVTCEPGPPPPPPEVTP